MPNDKKPEGPMTTPRDRPPGRIALLIIDMINCFDFRDADILMPKALRAADAILALRRSVEEAGWPVIYVNDNFSEWHSERSRLIERALENDNPVSSKLRPAEHDYFIIKPQFSGFYATNLPVLLPKLGVSRLILTGVATDICVLFTAGDAHMRDYALWIPEDAVAATHDERSAWALEIMRESMGAETAPSTSLSVEEWTQRLDAKEKADAPG